MVEHKKKGLITEDWLAFYIAIILMIISFVAYLGVDPFGWTVKTSEWVSLDKALAPLRKKYAISGFVSLILILT